MHPLIDQHRAEIALLCQRFAVRRLERTFEIIGEALGQLAKVDATLAARISDIREMIAFRNVLIHGYAVVEHDRVWRIAVAALLEELGPAG